MKKFENITTPHNNNQIPDKVKVRKVSKKMKS